MLIFRYLCCFIFFSHLKEAAKLTQPVLIGYLVRYLRGDDSVSSTDSYLYAVAVFLCSLAFHLPNALYIHCKYVMAMKWRVVCTSLIYEKVLFHPLPYF